MEIKIWINRDLGKSMMKASVMDFVKVQVIMGTREEASEESHSRDGRYIKCFLKGAIVKMSLQGEVGGS